MAGAASGSSQASPPARRVRDRQAVVVIHGMGEQVPMETLRSFVDTVWSRDPEIRARTDADKEDFGDDNPTWSKPEVYSEGFELRRIATRRYQAGKDGRGKIVYGPRTDFFEFYWADVMQGTSWSHLADWLKTLLFRLPTQVPRGVFWAWLVLWAAAIFIFLLGLEFGSLGLKELAPGDSMAADYLPVRIFGAWRDFVAGSGTLLALVWFVWRTFLKQGFLVSYLGDVARYVRAQPCNINKRHTVRSKGVDFLRRLNDNGPYKRIVVVGHSLGSIVAYDLLTYLWAEYNAKFGGVARSANVRALRDLERAARALRRQSDDAGRRRNRKRYRELQRKYFEEIAGHPESPWVISDFVTLGSPLTHADFLIARTRPRFDKRIKLREFPICPPSTESLKVTRSGRRQDVFTYPWNPAEGAQQWLPHHATVFAPVRWTNVHCRHWFTNLLIFPGDMVSGPVSPLFGEGIVDRRVWMWNWALGFAHTSYWTWKSDFEAGDPPDHITLLRAAVNLRNEPDPVLDLTGMAKK